MKNKNHTLSCYKYCNRVYGLIQKIIEIEDGRTDPTIKLEEIVLTILFSLMSGLHSFHAMEGAIEDGDFDKFFANMKLPSADTFPYSLMEINLEDLRKLTAEIVQKARYNKSLNNNTIDGLKVVAIDGTHTFTMKSENLGKNAHKHEHRNNDGDIKYIDYREKAIAASYVGEGFSPILKINRIPKGEGEITAAKKLVNELNEDHYQYCDVIVGDSLYINAPFINTVLRNNKDVVVRVKQKNNLMIKDAKGLFKNRKPDHTFEDISPQDKEKTSGTFYDIEIWDEENFKWSDVDVPLRVLKVKERKKQINADGEIVKEEIQICYFATTMEKSQLKSFTVWKIAHRRWDEENGVFHWIKTYWNFDRRYCSNPVVIQAMYYLYVIAYNLFHLYIHRNLRSFDPEKETKKKFIRRFYKGLVTLKEPLYGSGIDPG